MNAPRPNAPASEVRAALAKLRPFFVRSAWFSTIASLLVLGSSWYMLEVYDRVVNSRSITTLVMLTIAVLTCYAVMEILEWAHGEEMREAGLAFDASMRNRVLTAAFGANLRKLPGGNSQPLSDLRTLREFLPSPVLRAVMESPMAVVFLFVLLWIHPYLALAGLFGAVAQTLVTWMNERATQPPLSAANRNAIAAQQYADGTIRNAQVIEAMGMLRDIHKRWFAKQSEFLQLQVQASERAGVYTAISKFFQTVLSSGLLGIGAYLLLQRELAGGAGMIIIASIIGGRVLQPLVQVVSQWRAVVQARDALTRLDVLLASVPQKPASMSLPAPRGKFNAENLLVAAPGAQVPILKGVTFALNPGDVLAVIGPSACGKTTLARAIIGLWPSMGGKARLDGADVHAWDKGELGPHIGYLPQGIELFDGTIAENIARFGEVDMLKVEAAARQAGLHEFISALPDGYETEVGSEGARLSGGQRQRVGLARAMYGDPSFLVLDEPNSSLDDAGEAALMAAIRAMKQRGATIVVITHRASLVNVADLVLLMRDGSVQIFGPRDEVTAALARASQEAAARAQQAAAQQNAAARAVPGLAT
jgi:ATP-binding cassette subfamily C exporter for protease/lipase